jgi:hypothetical protein
MMLAVANLENEFGFADRTVGGGVFNKSRRVTGHHGVRGRRTQSENIMSHNRESVYLTELPMLFRM